MTSKIYTDKELELAVKKSTSVSEVLRQIGLSESGGSHSHLSLKIKKLGFDTSHFLSQSFNSTINLKQSWDYYLIKSNKTRRLSAKISRRALIEFGREYKCEICSNVGEWNGKKLTLQVDHINGDKSNNLPENLRFLCPNCHTQTCNFGSKKRKVIKAKVSKFKINWPTKEELEKLVWQMPMQKLSNLLKVSDKSISKRCDKLGIIRPSQGYWLKHKAVA